MHTPAAAGGAVVEPGKLRKAAPLVIDKVFDFEPASGFQNDDVDAFLCEFVAERTAAGTGADDDDDAVVVQIMGLP